MSSVHVLGTREPRQVFSLLERLNPQIDCDHVFIKPNLVIPARPASGIVTDPAFVKGIVEYLRQRGIGNITIGESSAVSVDVEEAFRVSGFSAMARSAGVPLLNLDAEETMDIPWAFGTLRIPRIMAGAYYINAAKLKTHFNTTVSLGLKNQKGLIRDGTKKLMHTKGLHMPIVELARAVRPNLTVIDGIVGLEGDGPSVGGKRVQSNVVIASEDIVAADAAACRVMGVDPYEVQHIRLAAEAGLGCINPEVFGSQIAEVKRAFRRANEQYTRRLRVTKWRNPHACSTCGGTLSEAAKKIATDPHLAVTCGPKFAYGMLLGRIDVIIGANAEIPHRHGKIICLGRCTKALANRHGLVWVDGCPPNAVDIVEGLRRL